MLTNFEQFFQRILIAFNCKSDTELANYLNINKSTLSMWKKRESVDYDKLFTKIEPAINIDWLITGRGEIYLDGSSAPIVHDPLPKYGNKDIKEIALNLSEVIARQQKELKSLNDRISELEHSKKKK